MDARIHRGQCHFERDGCPNPYLISLLNCRIHRGLIDPGAMDARIHRGVELALAGVRGVRAYGGAGGAGVWGVRGMGVWDGLVGGRYVYTRHIGGRCAVGRACDRGRSRRRADLNRALNWARRR